MDTMSAFAMGQAAKGREQMVFDWDKAARILRAREATYAEAGLCGDWDWTGGAILDGGKPDTGSYTYLSSNWARPQLIVDSEVIVCWRYARETPGWNAETKWPESALAILRGEAE